MSVLTVTVNCRSHLLVLKGVERGTCTQMAQVNWVEMGYEWDELLYSGGERFTPTTTLTDACVHRHHQLEDSIYSLKQLRVEMGIW